MTDYTIPPDLVRRGQTTQTDPANSGEGPANSGEGPANNPAGANAAYVGYDLVQSITRSSTVPPNPYAG